MSDYSNLYSALSAPQSLLLPAAEVFPATQRPLSSPAFLLVPGQQPAVLPDNPPILINRYPFDTLPLYNPNDYRSPAEQWRTLPHPIDIESGMVYTLAFRNAFMLYSWIEGPSRSASNTGMYRDAWPKEVDLMNGSKTSWIASKFNQRLKEEKARLRPMILVEMQQKNCCFSCLVQGRSTPCQHAYPQRPTQAANGQGGVQNGHGERLNHVQRGEGRTASSGAPQSIPPATPAIRTVGGINQFVTQLVAQWDQTEGYLIAAISDVAFHGIIANEGQQARDLKQVLSWIDDFVITAKHRFDEVRTLLSGFRNAVRLNSTRTPAPSPCLNPLNNIKKFTRALQERLIVGLLKILVPLFTFHPDMGTTEALLMLRIEGCKRGWIPFLTEVLRVAFGGHDGAEITYLRTKARNQVLWKFWSKVVMGDRWAINAMADPRCIHNGLSTSSLKVYLMPMGWNKKGWDGLWSCVTDEKPTWFLKDGVHFMIWEMGMQMNQRPSANRRSMSQSSQQPGGDYDNHRNSSSSSSSNSNKRHPPPPPPPAPPPPQPKPSQMKPMANAGNHGQQPKQNGIGYGGMYASPPGPPPSGHGASPPQASSSRMNPIANIGNYGQQPQQIGIGYRGMYASPPGPPPSAQNPPPAQANGYGGLSGIGSRKRRREEGGAEEEKEAFASEAVAKRVQVLRNQGW